MMLAETTDPFLRLRLRLQRRPCSGSFSISLLLHHHRLPLFLIWPVLSQWYTEVAQE